MLRSRRLALVLALSALIASAAFDSFACYLCKYSPHGWGFCRAGYNRGHSDCREIVVDSFNGRTGCDIINWGDCYNGGSTTEEDGDPYTPPPPSYAENNPCWWTDTEAIRQV